MKTTERLVLYYDLSMNASSRTFDAPQPISVKRAFELMDMVPLAMRAKRRARGTQTLYVTKWEAGTKYIKILINKSDKNIADPIFTIPSKRARRTAAKQPDEGQDFSAHVVVKFPQNAEDPALMLVEQCSGLNATTIAILLRSILRQAKSYSPDDFVQRHPDGSIDEKGQPLTYNVLHGVDIVGHPSDSFIDELTRGQIHSLELITERFTRSGIDTGNYFIEHKESLMLTPSQKINRPRDIYKYIKNLVVNNSKKYGGARLKFSVPESKIEKTVNLDTANGLPEHYVKKDLMQNFTFALQSSYEDFNEEILKIMLFLAK